MDRISAFMDGEARQHESRQAMLNLERDEKCRATWHTFHLIGDVLRGERLLQDDFAARLRGRLQLEPAVLAPVRWRKAPNIALSAAAGLAAVAVVLTLAFMDNPLAPRAPIASAPPPAAAAPSEVEPVAQPHPVAAADQRKVDEYLMAHQEFSPSVAWHGVVPYVRTVSSARDGRVR